MRAVIVDDFGAKPEVREVPRPSPSSHEVLVRLEASGLCHTDIHAARGDWPVQPHLPFTPGHEGVGVVEQIGADVTEVTVGDRVAMPWFGYGCGVCGCCVDGRETLSESQRNTGYYIDGGLREYSTAHARYVVKVPDGGLGHLAVQHAKLVGGFVTAVDVVDEKRSLAKRLGADHLVNAAEVDPVVAIQAEGGADVAVVLAASSKVFEQAFHSLRRGGRLICVGLPKDGAFELPIFETVLKGVSVIGSIVGTRQDLREVFALHAAGRTEVVAETRDLADIAEAKDEVLAGKMPARIVFEFASA